MRSNKHEYYGKAGRWQCINCPMENVKSCHQSSRRVGNTQNWEQMTMPFWEPIPYTVWLMHCKKLRAQTPTGNLLKTINSEYVLYSTKEKKTVKHFFISMPYLISLLSSLSSQVCLSFTYTRVCTGAHTHRHARFCLLFSYLPCVYSLVSFTSHTLHLPVPSFKSTALIAKPSSR